MQVQVQTATGAELEQLEGHDAIQRGGHQRAHQRGGARHLVRLRRMQDPVGDVSIVPGQGVGHGRVEVGVFATIKAGQGVGPARARQGMQGAVQT
ncbi:hypothetical protein QE419_000936 [Brevundimonas vesicularis]|nr:hypothetical protein [Brevundimonas vesicularis]